MTQFTTQTNQFLNNNRHIYEVNYLANNANGDIVSVTNPLPVTLASSGGTGGQNIVSFPDASVTAFDEPLSVGITPVLQGSTVYGIDPEFWNESILRGGSINVTNTHLFQVCSGTSAGGYARLATSKYVTYQPGQGIMFRWTAAFTANGNTKDALGVDNIVQNTGPIDRENGYSIGFSGSSANDASRKIGILHRRQGYVETRQLTINTAPTGTQTATITLNGQAFTVNITSGTTSHAAHEIAAGLKANTTADNLWDIDACDSIVTVVYYTPGSQAGTYGISSSGVGTLVNGGFTQVVAGSSPSDTWTYVDDWNGTIPASFDPTKLNVYGMDMRWLGSGRVRFFMEDPDTGKMVLIHTKKWTKDQTALAPHIRNPSLRIVYRSGTTNPAITPSQNVIVSGASCFGGIQGVINQTGSSQSYYSLDGTSRAKDTVWHLLSIQNPFVRNNAVNKSSLIIQDISISVKSVDPAVLYLVKNATGTSGLLEFNPLPNATAFNFAQYSVSAVSENLANDSLSLVQTIAINGSAQFNLLPYNFTLAPGEYMSAFISSTNSFNSTSIGIAWKID